MITQIVLLDHVRSYIRIRTHHSGDEEDGHSAAVPRVADKLVPDQLCSMISFRNQVLC